MEKYWALVFVIPLALFYTVGRIILHFKELKEWNG
jgi:hypothetical protein